MDNRSEIINELYTLEEDVKRVIKSVKNKVGCGHDRYDFQLVVDELERINTIINDATFLLDMPDPDNECDCDQEISDEEEEEYIPYFEERRKEIRKLRSLKEGGV